MTSEPMEVSQAKTLHYKGNTTDYDADFILGPDWADSYYRFVGADHDPVLDRTTMTLKVLHGEELKELMMKTMGMGLTTSLGTIRS